MDREPLKIELNQIKLAILEIADAVESGEHYKMGEVIRRILDVSE